MKLFFILRAKMYRRKGDFNKGQTYVGMFSYVQREPLVV